MPNIYIRDIPKSVVDVCKFCNKDAFLVSYGSTIYEVSVYDGSEKFANDADTDRYVDVQRLGLELMDFSSECLDKSVSFKKDLGAAIDWCDETYKRLKAEEIRQDRLYEAFVSIRTARKEGFTKEEVLKLVEEVYS